MAAEFDASWTSIETRGINSFQARGVQIRYVALDLDNPPSGQADHISQTAPSRPLRPDH